MLIFLIGFRASGKTTVGRDLASRLGARFVDTDRWIEASVGADIATYFDSHGEEAFRERETECLESLINGNGLAVIATGGGIVIRRKNVDLMREHGTVVWLRADCRTLRDRLAADPETARSRPGLTGRSAIDEVPELLARREPLYDAAAHWTVSVDSTRTPAQISREIAERLGESPR